MVMSSDLSAKPAQPQSTIQPAAAEGQPSAAARSRKVVLGLGNFLNNDEGLGVHALQSLEVQFGAQTTFELLDGGVLGLNLLMVVEECSHLLILDAINAGKPAGSVIELRKEEIPLYAGVKLSQHQITFQEVLGLANMRGYLPEHLMLIGVQPQDLSIGVELSPIVAQAIPEVVRRVVQVLTMWGGMKKEE